MGVYLIIRGMVRGVVVMILWWLGL